MIFQYNVIHFVSITEKNKSFKDKKKQYAVKCEFSCAKIGESKNASAAACKRTVEK